jgi:hypothetical protein
LAAISDQDAGSANHLFIATILHPVASQSGITMGARVCSFRESLDHKLRKTICYFRSGPRSQPKATQHPVQAFRPFRTVGVHLLSQAHISKGQRLVLDSQVRIMNDIGSLAQPQSLLAAFVRRFCHGALSRQFAVPEHK